MLAGRTPRWSNHSQEALRSGVIDMTIVADKPLVQAQTFKLRTQLLKEGRTHRIVASTKGSHGAMNIAMKCYAEGGENTFHAHGREDHTFVILQGRARFYQPDMPSVELGRNEGILLPAGAMYRFESCADEPLVIFRVGNVYQPLTEGGLGAESSNRVNQQGKLVDAYSAENKHIDPVMIDGAWYE
jgi:mannose-6-phosphate isomerase-like protein (cupin superfamily)